MRFLSRRRAAERVRGRPNTESGQQTAWQLTRVKPTAVGHHMGHPDTVLHPVRRRRERFGRAPRPGAVHSGVPYTVGGADGAGGGTPREPLLLPALAAVAGDAGPLARGAPDAGGAARGHVRADQRGHDHPRPAREGAVPRDRRRAALRARAGGRELRGADQGADGAARGAGHEHSGMEPAVWDEYHDVLVEPLDSILSLRVCSDALC